MARGSHHDADHTLQIVCRRTELRNGLARVSRQVPANRQGT